MKKIFKKKPSDYRWLIIVLLLLSNNQVDSALLQFTVIGMATYPAHGNNTQLFNDAGDKIGDAYGESMEKLYEIGYRLGERTYPYNNELVWLWIILQVLFYLWIVWWIIRLIGYNFYEHKKKKPRKARSNQKGG